ncbi:hypothetical protein SK128_012830 [Halocaridina rubra]|uniref:Uncharacterized protein n=1 Tax=Halocaridina rubra TaxID=373956 RepID=A0AAN8WW86_HALRR
MGGLTLFKSVLFHYPHLVSKLYLTIFTSGYDCLYPSDFLDERVNYLLEDADADVIFDNRVVSPNYKYVKYTCRKECQFLSRNNDLKNSLFNSYSLRNGDSTFDVRFSSQFHIYSKRFTGNKYVTCIPSLNYFDPLSENAGERRTRPFDKSLVGKTPTCPERA